MAGVDNGTDFDRDVLAIEEGHHGLAFLQLASGVAVAVSVLEVPEEWVNNLAIERVLFDEGDVGGRKFQCFLSGEKTFCEFSVHTTNVAHLGYLSRGSFVEEGAMGNERRGVIYLEVGEFILQCSDTGFPLVQLLH